MGSHHRHRYRSLTCLSFPRGPWSRPLHKCPKLAPCSSSQCKGSSRSTWLKRCVSPPPTSGQTGARPGLSWGGVQAPQAARREWSSPGGMWVGRWGGSWSLQNPSPILGAPPLALGCGRGPGALLFPGTWQFKAQVLLREISVLPSLTWGGDLLVGLLSELSSLVGGGGLEPHPRPPPVTPQCLCLSSRAQAVSFPLGRQSSKSPGPRRHRSRRPGRPRLGPGRACWPRNRQRAAGRPRS